MIGQDATTGVFRFSFGIIDFAAGLDLVPVLIGLFAVSEILNKAKGGNQAGSETIKVDLDSSSKLTLRELWASKIVLLRSTIIGIIIGAIPGTGGGIAAFLGYHDAKKLSKNPDEFGQGAWTASWPRRPPTTRSPAERSFRRSLSACPAMR